MRERVYFVGLRKDLHIKKCFTFPISDLSGSYNMEDFLCDTRDEFILDLHSSKYETFIRYLSNKYNKNKFILSELLQEEYLILDTRQSDLRLYRNRVPTIRRDRQGILYVKNGKLRNLSGYEALLLQGFDKDYAEKAIINQKNSHLLAQAGNAMTVNVINAIASQLKHTINFPENT